MAEHYYTSSSRSGTPLSHIPEGGEDSFTSATGLPGHPDDAGEDDRTGYTADLSPGEAAERRRRRRARRETVATRLESDEDRDPARTSTRAQTETWWEGSSPR
jgi:hypothetical protein